MRIKCERVFLVSLIIVVVILYSGQDTVVENDVVKTNYFSHLLNIYKPTANVPKQHYTSIWRNVLAFVPRSFSNCQELFPDFNKTDIYTKVHAVKGLHDLFDDEVHRHVLTEGHTGQSVEETLIYIQLSKVPFVKTICETGFNAGHSTFVWLTGKPDTHVYSFDLGKHIYSRPMSEFLQRLFPGRLNVTWGSSVTTLPTFTKMFPNIKCDLIIIDGGHTYEIAKADYYNFKQMANTPNILVLDDYPGRAFKMIGRVWEQAKRKKELIEKFRCSYLPHKDMGLTFGHYIDNLH